MSIFIYFKNILKFSKIHPISCYLINWRYKMDIKNINNVQKIDNVVETKKPTTQKPSEQHNQNNVSSQPSYEVNLGKNNETVNLVYPKPKATKSENQEPKTEEVPFDQKRVDDLKKRIADGTYRPDTKNIAQNMIETAYGVYKK